MHVTRKRRLSSESGADIKRPRAAAVDATRQDNVTVLGKYGTGDWNFNRPQDACWTDEGHLVVADTFNHRIQIFDEKLQFLRSFGGRGKGCDRFMFPFAVCMGKGALSNLLFIADQGNDRVVISTTKGDFLRFLPCLSPHGVCVDANDNIFTSSWVRNLNTDGWEDFHIAVMDKDGQPLRKTGSKDQQEPRLLYPGHLFVSDEHNQLFISDTFNYRIVVTSLEGQLLHSFGAQGKGPRQFDCTKGICMSQDNKLFIGDMWNNRVVCYDWDGESERFMGSTGAGAEFKWPVGVCIDSRGRLAVTDPENDCVVVVKDIRPSRVPFLMCLLK